MKINTNYCNCENSGLRIFYRQFGEGPPLILLHGGWLTGDLNWSDYYEELAKQFTVYVPDCRGHGHTQNPDAHFSSYGRQAWEMIEFIKSLKLKQPPLLMGYSSGAIISLHISIFEPRLIARQVLLSVFASIGTSENFFRGMEKIFVTPSYRHPPVKWHYILRHPLNFLALRKAHTQTPWFDLLQKNWKMWIKPLELEASDYKKIICPTLVMAGSRDEFGTIEEAKHLISSIRTAEFTALEGENHMVVVYKPALILEHALPFLMGSKN